MQIRQKEEVNVAGNVWSTVHRYILSAQSNKRINKTRCINGIDRMPYV